MAQLALDGVALGERGLKGGQGVGHMCDEHPYDLK
jgi:hypothetical protein